jgi:arsenite methyltransferase
MGNHGHHHHEHHGFADANAMSTVLDDPTRDEWQRPDDVLRALMLDPTMTVADIGAGTGYFAVRLARAVPRGEVIATDHEPGMIRFLNERARREHLSNLRAHEGTPIPRTVDRMLLVHVWHHLDEHEQYPRALAAALKPGGRMLIVDFSPAALRGPPESMRIAPEVVIATLERAGLSARLSSISIPDQYLVEATRG